MQDKTKYIVVCLNLLFVTLLVIIGSFSSVSQTSLQYFTKSAANRLDTFSIEKSQEALRSSENILYGPIDKDEYLVGPGDKFYIQVITSNITPVEFKTSITPESKILLRGVGGIELKGMTLSQAYDAIKTKLNSVYNTDNIDVSITDIRQFKVTVNGTVVSKGPVSVYSSFRAYDAIMLAGGLTIESSLRNIFIFRGEDTLKADLLKYTYQNSLKHNPYLIGGDMIYVNNRNKYDIISILGEVQNPGEYEYIKGDKLSDVFDFAAGFEDDAMLDSVEISRFDRQTGRTNYYFIDATNIDEVTNFTLQSGDRIYVRKQKNLYDGDYAVITGEVIKPGRYQIDSIFTTISDIFRRSGGVKENASLENAVLYRRKNTLLWDPEMARLIREGNRNSYTEEEKKYYDARKNERYGALSLDLSNINPGSKEDLVLIDLDSIHVPAKLKFVNVQGRVKNPGLIEHKPGLSYEDYIALAGGYSSDADDSEVLINKLNGSNLSADDDEYIIEPGDSILVPTDEPLDSSLIVTNTIAIVAQVLAIVGIAISLSR
ncbi:MAG: SLBB domain-containing protein [Candidatus Kapaibacteriales bacterium]